MSDIENQLKELISEATGIAPEKILPEKNFWNDLGIDSVKAIEIVVKIERTFKVVIRDEQITHIDTLNKAVDAIKQALEKKAQ